MKSILIKRDSSDSRVPLRTLYDSDPRAMALSLDRVQRRLFTAASSDAPTDFATALDLDLNSVDSPILGCYTSKEGEPERIC